MPEVNNYINQLYTAHKDELHQHICRKFTLDSETSEDIVQSAFTKFSHLDNALAIGNPRAYLYKVAHNLVIDMKRKDKFVDRSKLSNELQDDADHTFNDPARIHCARQELDIIEKVIKSMPDQRRSLLEMSRFESLPNTEIARRKGISETAVRKNVARALLDIRTALTSSNKRLLN